MSIVTTPLLGPRDPPPWRMTGPRDPARPVLLVCDHATWQVPAVLDSLGLQQQVLRRHIGWDIGAGAVTEALSSMLAVPAVLGNFSRLVVDCNRRLEDPTAYAADSDNVPIPGNVALTDADKARRAEAIYWPYHRQIAQLLQRLGTAGQAPVLIAIHSFTPVMGGVRRPWHLGVLWDQDSRVAQPLLQALRAGDGVLVGDNEPYSGRHPAGFTLDYHAAQRGLPHVAVEIRQDLIESGAGPAQWAELLAAALQPILANPRL